MTGWAVIVIAVLCALAWRKHRSRQGKKVSWYTDLLIAAGIAFVLNFVVGFTEGFGPTFVRSFIQGYRNSANTEPSTSTVYFVLGVFYLILAGLLIGFVFGARYCWKLWKLRQSNSTTA